MSEIKQVIVIRTNYEKDGKLFKPRTGKLIAQACHASMKWLALKLKNTRSYYDEWENYVMNNDFSQVEWDWLVNQKFTKIVCKVETEQELLDLDKKARDSGLTVGLVQDYGLTEFEKPEYTALGIGPDYSEKIDPITRELKLL